MMMNSKHRIFILGKALAVCLALLAAGTPALASQQTLTLDPDATTITFLLEATGHDVHGNLYLREGELALDFDRGTASGEIIIDALGTETGNKKRDRDMHEKVLESQLFPVFVFRATGLSGTLARAGTSSLQVAGTLSIHGDEHPLTLSVVVTDENGQLHAETVFDVPYVEWGMKDPSLFVLRVAKAVSVEVAADVELVPLNSGNTLTSEND